MLPEAGTLFTVGKFSVRAGPVLSPELPLRCGIGPERFQGRNLLLRRLGERLSRCVSLAYSVLSHDSEYTVLRLVLCTSSSSTMWEGKFAHDHDIVSSEGEGVGEMWRTDLWREAFPP